MARRGLFPLIRVAGRERCHRNARWPVIKGETEQANLLHCREHARAGRSRNIARK
jgi:hypothetical protein